MRRCRFEYAVTIDATVKKRRCCVRRTGYRAPLYHLPYRWGSEKTIQVIMSNRGNVGMYYYASFIRLNKSVKYVIPIEVTSVVEYVLYKHYSSSTLRQVHSFFQSEFSQHSNLVLTLSSYTAFSFSSCLRLFPRLFLPSILPSIKCFRRQLL